MKKLFLIIFVGSIALLATAQSSQTMGRADSTHKFQVVEAACGECQFGLTGKDCDLAVRIDGHAYFVDGAHIDGFGDAHAKNGFCKTVRKAEVQGAVKGGRFKASYFRLLPEKPDKP